MSKPTESDFINAHIVTDRILLRKLFEELRDRPQSKYFKHVVIKDIPWNEKTFRNSFPLNFPIEFLEKYPFDFEISFTILGCNMLKCYNNNNNTQQQPTLINNAIYAGNEACTAIYKEFNDYLREKIPFSKEKKKRRRKYFPL